MLAPWYPRLRVSGSTHAWWKYDDRSHSPCIACRLQVTLVGDVWRRDLNLASGIAVARQLLDGLRAKARYAGGQRLPSAEPFGWDEIVLPQLGTENLLRFDDSTVRITIPQCVNYDIRRPQTLELTVPPEAVLSNEGVRASNLVVIRATSGSVAASGSLLNATERAVVDGASLVLTLTADTWQDDVGREGATTDALLAGISATDSARNVFGWNAVVRKQLSALSVHRLSDTVVRIDVQGALEYDIVEPELVTIVVPYMSLVSHDTNLTVQPQLKLAPTPGTLMLGGSLCNGFNTTTRAVRGSDAFKYSQFSANSSDILVEEACLAHDRWLQTGLVDAQWAWSPPNQTNLTLYNTSIYNTTLHLQLENDSWVPGVGVATGSAAQPALTSAVLRGLKSQQTEANGWNAVVRPQLTPYMVERASDTLLVLHLPPVPQYQIREPESIALQVPSQAVLSRAALEARATLEFESTLGSRAALLSGSLIERGSEALLRSPNDDAFMDITLVNDTWRDAELDEYAALIAGFQAQTSAEASSPTNGWAATVTPALQRDLDVFVVDTRTVRLGFPQVANYDIVQTERLTLTIPGALLTSRTDLVASPRLTIVADAGSASLTGTLLDDPAEAVLKGDVPPPLGNGGSRGSSAAIDLDDEDADLTLRITLVHDTWASWDESTSAPFVLPAEAQDAIIRGFGSPTGVLAEPGGWDAIVTPRLLGNRLTSTLAGCSMISFNRSTGGDYRWVSNSTTGVPAPNVTSGHVLAPTQYWHWNETVYEWCPTAYSMVADSPSSLTLTVPPVAAYEITRPESVKFLVDPAVVTSGRSYEAWPTLTVLPTRGGAEFLRAESTLLGADETEVRKNASTSLAIRLTGDKWLPGELGGIFSGLTARQSDPFGWDAVVAAGLKADMVSLRDGDTTLVITLPPFIEYDIRMRETIVLTVPAHVVQSHQRPRNHLEFTIDAVAGGAILNGTVLNGLPEHSIRTLAPEDISFTIRLLNDTWAAGDALLALAGSITSAQAESNGWASIGTLKLQRLDEAQVQVTIPRIPSFSIDAPEVISVVIPASTLLSYERPILAGSFTILADAGRAFVGGDLLRNLTTTTLVTSRQELTLTLQDDTWSDAMYDPNATAVRAAMLNGLRSTKSEQDGWNAVVVTALLARNDVITVVDSKHLTVNLPRAPGYRLVEPETLLWRMAGECVRSGIEITASPQFEVFPAAAVASMHAPELMVGGIDEKILISNTQKRVNISLSGDSFRPSIGSTADADGHTLALLQGLFALQSEANGWNAAVLPLLTSDSLERLSDTLVQITLPTASAYDIDAPETVVCVVPGVATLGQHDITAPERITISPEPGTAAISGPIFINNSEPALQRAQLYPARYQHNASARLQGSLILTPHVSLVRAGGATILVELYEDHFIAGTASASAVLAALSSSNESGGWEDSVRPLLAYSHVGFAENSTVLNITLPPIPEYAIVTPEVLRLTLPAAVLQSSTEPINVLPAIRIQAETSEVELTGTLLTSPILESNLITGTTSDDSSPLTLVLRLDASVDEHWVSRLEDDMTLRRDLIRGMRSMQMEPRGWSALSNSLYSAEWNVSATEVAIRLPPVATFAINEPETIEVKLPGHVLSSERARVPSPHRFVIRAAPPSLIDFSSDSIVDGWLNASMLRHPPGVRLRIRLHGDAFVDALGHDDALARLLIDSIDASPMAGGGAEPRGWNAIVRQGLRTEAARAMVRLDQSTVVVNVPVARGYHIDAAETLRIVLPSALLLSQTAANATNSEIILTPSNASVELDGNLLLPFGALNATAAVAMGATNLTLTLHHVAAQGKDRSMFSPSLALAESMETKLLLGGLRACRRCNDDAMGWNRHMDVADMSLRRVDDHSLVVYLPPLGHTFELSEPETISVLIPADAYCNLELCASCPCATFGALDALAAPPIVIRALGGSATVALHLSGSEFVDSAGTSPAELNVSVLQLRTASRVGVTFTLTGDRWSDVLADELLPDRHTFVFDGLGVATRTLIANSLRAVETQPSGWNELIAWGTVPADAPTVRLDSNFSLTIEWPTGAFAGYAPRAPETVLLGLPAEAVRSHTPLALGQLVITVDPGSVTMTGGLTVKAHEEDLRSVHAHVLDMTLVGDTWLPGVGLDGAESSALLSGLASTQSETGGWRAVVAPMLSSTDLLRLDDQTVRLTIPQIAGYDIAAPETLRLTVPQGATFARSVLTAPEAIVVEAAVGVATLTGTLTEKREDRAIRIEPTTLVVTLARDEWVDALWDPSSHPLLAQTLLSAFVPSESQEPTGWNVVVRPALTPSALTRIDNYTMILTLPPTPGYRLVGASETITVHLAPELVKSDQLIRAEPSVEIVRAESLALQVSVVKDSWQAEVGSDDISSSALLAGLRALDSGEPNGWNVIVGPRLRYPDIEKVDRATLFVHVPQFHDYEITRAETIRMTLPSEAMASRTSFIATPDLVIYPFSGFASLGGALSLGSSESALRSAEHVLLLELVGNSFLPVLSNASDPRQEEVANAILHGLTSNVDAASAPGAWNDQLTRLRAVDYVTVLSARQIEVRLPPLITYETATPEEVVVTLPADALLGQQPLGAGAFRILADPGRVTLSGSLLDASSESTVVDGKSEIVIDLIGDAWDGVASDPVLARELIVGFTGSGGGGGFGAYAWNAAVQPHLHMSQLRQLSETRLVLEIPQSTLYKIDAPETVTATLPASVLRSRRSISAASPLVIRADRGIVQLQVEHSYRDGHGDLALLEDVLTDDTTELTITLLGDSWDSDLGSLNSTGYADLVDSIYSDSNPWRFYITGQLDPVSNPGAVVRITSNSLKVYVPQTPAYAIETPETITISLPASATTSRRPYYAAGGFIVKATSPAMLFTGDDLDEGMLREDSAGKKITLQLRLGQGRFWNTGLVSPTHPGREQLLTDITSLDNEELGWNNMIAPRLRADTAFLLEPDAYDGLVDGQQMSLSLLLGQYDGYNITAPETIRVTLSGPPVLSTASLRVSAFFVVRATRGRASMAGALDEASVQHGVPHIIQVSLEDSRWASDFLAIGDAPEQLIASLRSEQSELSGFNQVLNEGISRSNLGISGDTLYITVPGSAAYSIVEPETITLHLPAASLSTRLATPVVGTVIVNATPGNATLFGGLAASPSEQYLRASSPSTSEMSDQLQVDVVLTNDFWADADALLDGSRMRATTALRFYADTNEPNGWNAHVAPRLATEAQASLLDSVTLRLRFPAVLAYDITMPETISLEVPPAAIKSRQTITLSPAVVIRALSGEARVGGTFVFATVKGLLINVTDAYEVQIQALGEHANWAPSIAVGGDSSPASGVVINAVALYQPELFNETFLGAYLPMNASHLTQRTNTSLRYLAHVPSDFYCEPVDVTFSLAAGAFAANASALVRLRTRWLMHVEEVHTGVTERHNYEASLFGPAPTYLATDVWTPNLLSQAQSNPSAPLMHTLELHLYGDSWVPAIGQADSGTGPTSQLLAALTSTQQEPGGWNRVILQSLDASHVTRADDVMVTITLPYTANYSIIRPETIDILLPAAALRSDAPISVSSTVAAPPWARWPPYSVHPVVIQPQVGSITMVTGLSSETDLFGRQQDGSPHTIRLHLDGDTWREEVGVLGDPVNVALVRGLTSANDDAVSGWNRVAREMLAFLAASTDIVRRLSETLVEIEMPYISGYEIDSVDNMSLVVPGVAVLTNQSTPSTTHFLISPSAGNCTLGGTLLGRPGEARLRTTPSTLLLRVVGDLWRQGDGRLTGIDDAIARDILAAVVSDQAEPKGWSAIVRPDLLAADVASRLTLLAPDLVQISLPAYPSYTITEPETIYVRLPGDVLQSRRQLAVAVTAQPPLAIRPSPVQPVLFIELTGGITKTMLTEADLRHDNASLHIILADDSWSEAVSRDTAEAAVLLGALRSQQEHARGNGWGAVVHPTLSWHNISLPDEWEGEPQNGTRLVIALPASPEFDIQSPETVDLVIPAVALRSGEATKAPSLVIAAEAGEMLVSGRLSAGTEDAQVRNPSSSDELDITLSLTGDTFVASVGMESTASASLLDGIFSTSSPLAEPFGFNAIIKPQLTRHSIVMLNASALRLRLPVSPAYALSAPETIYLSLNTTDEAHVPTTMSERVYYLALTTLRPATTLSPVRLQGTLLGELTEVLMRRSPVELDNPVLNLTLCCGLEFALPFDNVSSLALVTSLRARSPAQAAGWTAAIQPTITIQQLQAQTASLIVRPNTAYRILQPETIVLQLPDSLLRRDGSNLTGPIESEPFVILPSPPAMRLQEDGDALFFVPRSLWTPSYEMGVPTNGLFGTLLASELRASRLAKNLTLHLRVGFGDATSITDFWDAEALSRLDFGIATGFAASHSQANGWNEVVRYGPKPLVTAVNETLTIQWPAGAFAGYAPRAPETVLLGLPAEAVRSHTPLALGQLVITVDPGSVTMTGGLTVKAHEEDLRSVHAHVLDMTLVGDTWLPGVGLDGAESSALLSGLASTQSETGGWRAVVAPMLSSTDLLRLDDQTVRLTIPQIAGYDIAAPETLRLTVPQGATFARSVLTAPESITFEPSAGTGRFGGDLMTLGNDASIQDASTLSLVLTLTSDLWSTDIETYANMQALLSGIYSLQGEEQGWNAIVQKRLLQQPAITRVSDTIISIAIPSVVDYDISAPETIVATIPKHVLESGQSPYFPLPFLVYPATPRAELSLGSGSIDQAIPEYELQTSAPVVLQVSLAGTTFSRHLGQETSEGVVATLSVLHGLKPTTTAEPNGWATTVSPRFSVSDLTVVGPTQLNISVRQAGSYRLNAMERIQLTIPANAVQYERASVSAQPLLTMAPSGAFAELSGSLLQPGSNNEMSFSASSVKLTLVITLHGAAWGPYTQAEDQGVGPTTDLLNGLRSAQSEEFGFNNVVQPRLAPRHVTKSDDGLSVIITFPSIPEYRISRPETITVTIPGGDPSRNEQLWTMLYPTPLVARPVFMINPTPGIAILSGDPLLAGVDERWLSSGRPIEFVITLQGDIWLPDVDQEDFGLGSTSALLSGITSLQSSASGFNAVIKPTLSAANLERLSDTEVRVRITDFLDYDLSEPETIQVTVNGGALMSQQTIVAAPVLPMLPIENSVKIAGDLLGASEVAIRSGLEPRLIIALESDTWTRTVGRSADATRQLLAGLRSKQSEENGWNMVVGPHLPPSSVEYIDAGEVHITIPQFAAYDITEPETIQLSIPKAAMRNNDADIPLAASFVVLAVPGTAKLGGTLLSDVTERTLIDGSNPITGNVTLEIKLDGDTFVPYSMCNGNKINITDLRAEPLPAEWCWPVEPFAPGIAAPPPPPPGPRCVPQQAYGFDAVLDEIPCEALQRLSPTHVRLQLPAFPAYKISTVETITATIRAAALTSSRTTIAYPRFAVRPSAGRVELGGDLLQATEATIRAGGAALTIKLIDDAWRPDLDEDMRTAVLSGLTSMQAEASGWGAIVQPALRRGSSSLVTQVDEQTVMVSLPAFDSFDLVSAETLRVDVPASAVLSGHSLQADALIELAAISGKATLRGFVDYDRTERAVRSGVSSRWSAEANALLSESMRLNITLEDDEWMPMVGQDGSVSDALLGTLVSLQAEWDGWNSRVRPLLSATHLFRASATTLLVDLPARANYGISAPEELFLQLPPEALRSNQSLLAPRITLQATAGLAFAHGSLLQHLHEEDLRSQSLTLNLTLVADSWTELLEEKFAHQLIDGCFSSQDEGHGWNAEYRAVLRPLHVTRVDATTVSIELPMRPSYDIAEPETITITVPPEAVTSNRTLQAEPRLVVLPMPGVAVLSASELVRDEVALRSAKAFPLTITLMNDTWLPMAVEHDTGEGVFSALRRGLRTSPYMREDAPRGWAAIVQPALDHIHWSVHNESTRIEVDVPQFADYEIDRPEMLSLTIPPGALRSRQRMRARGVLRIDASVGRATLSGPLVEMLTEDAIRAEGGLSVLVTLQGDAFTHGVGSNDLATASIVRGFSSLQAEPAGWNAVVQRALEFGWNHLTKLNSSALRIDLPPNPTYSISEPETVTLRVPETALVSNRPIAAAPSIVLRATPGRAVLGGSLASRPLEASVRQGHDGSGTPYSLRVTLRDDSWSGIARIAGQWALDGEAAAAQRAVVEALVDGMVSEQDEPDGWNSRVRPRLAQTNVTLEGAAGSGSMAAYSTLRFDLPSIPDFRIAQPETIFVRLPPLAVASSASIRVSPALVILADRRNAHFGGHLAELPYAATVRSDEISNVTIVLEEDIWHPAIGQPHLGEAERTLQRRVIDGLVSAQSEPGGWHAVVKGGLREEHVHRLDHHTLLIDLQQFANYAITSPETLVALIPPDAVLSRTVPAMRSALIVRPQRGRARLTGRLVRRASEAAIQSAESLDLAVRGALAHIAQHIYSLHLHLHMHMHMRALCTFARVCSRTDHVSTLAHTARPDCTWSHLLL